jgi:hypothetical protein
VKKLLSFFSIIGIATGLAGCISTQAQKPLEPIQYFTQPTTSQNVATIIGNREKSQSIMADKIAYVFAIDQQKINHGREQLQSPLALTAGEHNLQIWCQRGGYKYTNLVKVNLEAGRNYQVGFEMNVNQQTNCYFWIYDLEKKRAIGELVEGIEVGEYADPNKLRPILHKLEPRPTTRQNLYVPIRVINKMGHN